MKYALVIDGAVAEEREYSQPLDPGALKRVNGVPLLRPLKESIPVFDPATHAIGGHSYAVFDDRVEKSYTLVALPPPATASETYDRALQDDRVLKAAILSLADGSLRSGMTIEQAKAAIVAKM